MIPGLSALPSRDPLAANVTPSDEERSVCATYLRRCEASGIQFVITAPADTVAFGRDVRRFSRRLVDAQEHARLDTGYRAFRALDYQQRAIPIAAEESLPHDPGSWRILALTAHGEIAGALTCRIFTRAVLTEYLYDFRLLDGCTVVPRADYEIALRQLIASTASEPRNFCEASNWAVAPEWRGSPIGVALMLTLLLFLDHFAPYRCVVTANCDTGAHAMIAKFGGASVTKPGGEMLPPFWHSGYRAHLGLLTWTEVCPLPRYRATAAQHEAFMMGCRLVSRV